MTKRLLIFLVIILFVFCYNTYPKNDKKFIRQGNSLYNSKKYSDAEIKYRKALADNPSNKKAEFNLGDALYKQKNYKEAADKFKSLNLKKMDKDDKNDILYNLGNSYFEQGREFAEKGNSESSMNMLGKALNSYKNALKLDGNDEDARYNYEMARRLMYQQQQKQQQQNKNQDKQNQDKQNQEKQNQDKQNQDKQNQDKQNQKDKDKQKKENQDKQNQDNQNQNQNNKSENKQNQQQSKISKSDAERILNALETKEKQKLKDMKKLKASKAKIEKQW